MVSVRKWTRFDCSPVCAQRSTVNISLVYSRKTVTRISELGTIDFEGVLYLVMPFFQVRSRLVVR